jgi:hypothetical protein
MTQPLDMKKEYRAELKQLKAAERKVLRDSRAAVRGYHREQAKLERAHARAVRAVHKMLTRITRRKAILEGRLAS